MRATAVLHGRISVMLPWALVGDFTVNTRQRKLELLMSLWAISKSVSFLCKLGKNVFWGCSDEQIDVILSQDLRNVTHSWNALYQCNSLTPFLMFESWQLSRPTSPSCLAAPHLSKKSQCDSFREWVTDREAWHAAAHGVVNRRDWVTDLTPSSPSKKSKGAPTQEPLSTPCSKNSKPISFPCLLKQFSEQLAKSDFLFPESYLYRVKKKKKIPSYSLGICGLGILTEF